MTGGFSNYLVFVDESGDHGLDTIDPGYPMFVLAFCVIHKEDYVAALTPALQRFKMKHFGHDDVILHERDIRKDQGAFAFLKTKETKDAFLGELTDIVAEVPFTLICSAIRKDQLRAKYVSPGNPYHIALGFGLERVFYLLRDKREVSVRTHVMVERRGKESGRMPTLSWNFAASATAATTTTSNCLLTLPSSTRKAIPQDCSWPIWSRGRWA